MFTLYNKVEISILTKYICILWRFRRGNYKTYFHVNKATSAFINFYAHTLRGGGHLDLPLSVRPKIFNFVTKVEK